MPKDKYGREPKKPPKRPKAKVLGTGMAKKAGSAMGKHRRRTEQTLADLDKY